MFLVKDIIWLLIIVYHYVSRFITKLDCIFVQHNVTIFIHLVIVVDHIINIIANFVINLLGASITN